MYPFPCLYDTMHYVTILVTYVIAIDLIYVGFYFLESTTQMIENFYLSRGVDRIWQGGQDFFVRFGSLHGLCEGGSGACPPPPENFVKWCNLVRFGVYLDQILSLKNLKNYHFLYNFFLNTISYIKIYILDTRLLWGIFYEEIFENIL